MLNETEKNKLARFIDDEIMYNTVRKVLLDSFMKKRKDDDVYKLAAARIAIDLLHDGLKEVANEARKTQKEEKGSKNIAL